MGMIKCVRDNQGCACILRHGSGVPSRNETCAEACTSVASATCTDETHVREIDSATMRAHLEGEFLHHRLLHRAHVAQALLLNDRHLLLVLVLDHLVKLL